METAHEHLNAYRGEYHALQIGRDPGIVPCLHEIGKAAL